MSKRVNISVDLGALQAVIGEWPGIGEVATRLGKTQQDKDRTPLERLRVRRRAARARGDSTTAG